MNEVDRKHYAQGAAISQGLGGSGGGGGTVLRKVHVRIQQVANGYCVTNETNGYGLSAVDAYQNNLFVASTASDAMEIVENILSGKTI